MNTSNVAWDKLTTKEINEKLIESLEQWKLDSPADRFEFFMYISSFRFNNYSLRNKMILQYEAGFREQTGVFGTFKEWKERGTNIKKGSNAYSILVPYKSRGYQLKVNDDLGFPVNKDISKPLYQYEQDELKEMEKEGIIEVRNVTKFKMVKSLFSIDQTTMEEKDKIDYLQRFNQENTSEENDKILKRLVQISNALGVSYKEQQIDDASLGWIHWSKNEIVVKKEMPIDAKINVLSHEIGHYMLHRPELRNNLSNKDKEIQAELFAHLTLNSLNIEAENENSIKYIGNYLEQYTGDNWSLSELEKSVLFAHLQIVSKASHLLVDKINDEKLTLTNIRESIQAFTPDEYNLKEVVHHAKINEQQRAEIEMEEWER